VSQVWDTNSSWGGSSPGAVPGVWGRFSPPGGPQVRLELHIVGDVVPYVYPARLMGLDARAREGA
jgi:hypothetical protein